MSENESSGDGTPDKNWTAAKSIAVLKAANSGPARTVEDSFSLDYGHSTLAMSEETPGHLLARKVSK